MNGVQMVTICMTRFLRGFHLSSPLLCATFVRKTAVSAVLTVTCESTNVAGFVVL